MSHRKRGLFRISIISDSSRTVRASFYPCVVWRCSTDKCSCIGALKCTCTPKTPISPSHITLSAERRVSSGEPVEVNRQHPDALGDPKNKSRHTLPKEHSEPPRLLKQHALSLLKQQPLVLEKQQPSVSLKQHPPRLLKQQPPVVLQQQPGVSSYLLQGSSEEADMGGSRV